MVVPEEENDDLLLALLGDIEVMTTLPFVGEEAKDIDGHTTLILDCWDVLDDDWIMDGFEPVLFEEIDVEAWAIGVLFV